MARVRFSGKAAYVELQLLGSLEAGRLVVGPMVSLCFHYDSPEGSGYLGWFETEGSLLQVPDLLAFLSGGPERWVEELPVCGLRGGLAAHCLRAGPVLRYQGRDLGPVPEVLRPYVVASGAVRSSSVPWEVES